MGTAQQLLKRQGGLLDVENWPDGGLIESADR